MKNYRQKSEFIKEEPPDIVFSLDWETVVGIHPMLLGQHMLRVLRKEGIPVIGEVDVEGIESGRLYWDDYIDIGNRTYFYYKSEPKYIDDLAEYNICGLVCPICKDLCGGISDHLEETKDFLTPETEFHGCNNQHKWLSIDSKKKVKYMPIEWPIVTRTQTRIHIEDEEPEQEEYEQIKRSIDLDE